MDDPAACNSGEPVLEADNFFQYERITLNDHEFDGYEQMLQAAQNAVKALKKSQKTISTCESLTAGLCSAALASVPGASAVLIGGIVTYATRIKIDVADVPAEIIEQYGVISAQCAAAMARYICKKMVSDIGISFTGNAGPDTMEGKPAGLVYAAIAAGEKTIVVESRSSLDRNGVRIQIVALMLQKLADMLKKNPTDFEKFF